MGFEKMWLITVAIIAIVAPSALAKEFVVGDEKGWTVNFDYQTWAAGKDFRVGDKLSTFYHLQLSSFALYHSVFYITLMTL